MMQSASKFNHRVTAQHYIDLYEKMLQRPLIIPENTKARQINKSLGKKKPYVHNIMNLTDRSSKKARQPLSGRQERRTLVTSQ